VGVDSTVCILQPEYPSPGSEVNGEARLSRVVEVFPFDSIPRVGGIVRISSPLTAVLRTQLPAFRWQNTVVPRNGGASRYKHKLL
jgi:hypothetical protein